MAMDQTSPTLWLPTYSAAQKFIRIMSGTSYSMYWSMWQDITSKAGNKKSTVSWIDPDRWIPERLTDHSRKLALRLWNESGHQINPRWSYAVWRFVQSSSLATNREGAFVILPRGERFIEGDVAIIRKIDEHEGLLFLLSVVADSGPGTRRAFKPTFLRYFQHRTTWQDSSIASSFSVRLDNLTDRNLITKTGSIFQITEAGLSYLQSVSGSNRKFAPTVELVVSQKNMDARQELAEFLHSMNPFQFEQLVKRLLEEMGYEDVQVTSPQGDKGVDVVANIELGISRVREVIQVKRHQGNVGRPVLDALRGSLYYFNAVRGTIVSTGGFSKGTEDAAFLPGAPPITLIDGKRLQDLLIEHDIGVRRREIRILEFDPESLSEFESEAEMEAAALDEPESE